MSRRIFVVIITATVLLGCNRAANQYLRLIPAEQFPGAKCEKLPHEQVSAFRTTGPNSVFVVVGKNPEAAFYVDIAKDQVYEIPVSGLTDDKIKGWLMSQEAISKRMPIPADVAKYDARYYREGVSLEFSTPKTGKVKVDRINTEHLIWDRTPPPLPYDPYFHHQILVKNLHYDALKGVVSMDIVNKSSHPDFAILQPIIKVSNGYWPECWTDSGEMGAWEKEVELPAHSSVHHVVKVKGYRPPEYVFLHRRWYEFELQGSSALQGGGYVYDTPAFLFK